MNRVAGSSMQSRFVRALEAKYEQLVALHRAQGHGPPGLCGHHGLHCFLLGTRVMS